MPSISPNARQSGRVDLKAPEINIPGVVEIGSYHYRTARRGLENVFHGGCWGICHLAKGTQTYRIHGQHYHLKGGDQLITFPGETLDTAGTPEEKGHLYWFIFEMTPSSSPLLYLTPRAAKTLREALLKIPRRHFPAAPESDEMAATILNTLQSSPASELERLSAAHQLQHYLFLTLDAAHGTQAHGPSPRMQRALDYIEAHLDEPLPIPQLAKYVGLSESRFKNRFRDEVGTPPGDYILRTKITAATKALRSRDITVTELAFELGFSSSQYFATVFRRFTGTTPTAFRTSETSLSR